MSEDEPSEVLELLQPNLLTSEKLRCMIQRRCPKVQNLSSASKEQLVKLFCQIILPLPQRRYRTNRRGKLLTARRLKARLESKSEEEGEKESSKLSLGRSSIKRTSSEDRLKPPPDSTKSNKIRISSNLGVSQKTTTDLDKIVINDRRKQPRHDDESVKTSSKEAHAKSESTTSCKKVILKRSSSSSSESELRHSHHSTESPPAKKTRTAIKWP